MSAEDSDPVVDELSRLRSIVSDSTEFIKRWLPDGTRTYVNDAYCRYFGERREEILGTSFFTLLEPSARQLLEARIGALTPAHPVIIDEYPGERDGEPIWLEWTDRAIFDSEGTLVEMHSVGRDITDRHNAVEALRESEERYRSLVEDASDAIIVTSRTGEILHINPAGMTLLGFSSLDEALGTNIRSLYVDPRVLDSSLERLIDKGKLVDRELVLASIDGRELTVLQSASVIRDGDGKVSTIRTILHDITRRRQLEQQLQHAQRLEALGKLAGGVAHDFNNLLTVIGGNAELMASDLPAGGAHRVAIDSIREAAEKAVGLTQQLLAYGRRQVLSPEHLVLNGVVSETIAMLRRVVGEDIEILTSLAPDLGIVEADPNQIKQVLVNLALNGRDAMPAGGRLDISTGNVDSIVHAGQVLELGSFIRVTVSDTGIGIPEEHLPRIFEPFFTTKQMQRGTGLGLATVYGIIRQSNGRIFASNRADGGSDFDIYLPRVAQGKTTTSGSGKGSDPWSSDETVLLVEDDAQVRSTIRQTLEGRGYRVLEASGAADALQIYRREAADISLVVADVVMPRMNGYQMIDEMVACSPPRVLFISGHTDETLKRQQSAMPNLYPLLRKPFSPAMLVTRVREVLDGARLT